MYPIIFDLDDTLYPEITFVKGGFRAVSIFLLREYNIPSNESYEFMLSTMRLQGRGNIFDELLRRYNICSIRLIKKCISVYRYHKPNIQLFEAADAILSNLDIDSLFMVTDGNKNVQASKINALNLQNKFSKIFITHRYGVKHSKPSIYCFNLIREICGSTWDKMTYIGDNPHKDFINLKPLGVHTIRINTGHYMDVKVPQRFDAAITIEKLEDLNRVLNF